MQIPDSILAHHLRHVYWIGGGACGGKTTMAQMLATRHDMIHYNCDEHAMDYRQLAAPAEHPAIHAAFVDWEWYFSRSGAELASWLRAVFREQFPLTVVDLLRLGDARPIVCEGIFPARAVSQLAATGHVVFLYPEPRLLRAQYFAREDKQDMLRLIDRLSAPAQFKQNVLDCAMPVAEEISEAEGLGIRVLIRDEHTTLEGRLREIEELFGLAPLE